MLESPNYLQGDVQMKFGKLTLSCLWPLQTFALVALLINLRAKRLSIIRDYKSQ